MRRHKFLFCLITLTLLFLTGFAIRNYVDQDADKAYTPDNLIRFHVIANSDSSADQNLKLKVRDAVLSALKPDLDRAGTPAEARQTIKKQLDNLEQVARTEVAREGFDYDVSAQYGRFVFPAKTYGSMTLAEGSYPALKLVIGAGEGHNWWCVLFPPLCFVNIANSVATEPDSQDKQDSHDIAAPVLAPGENEDSGKSRVRVKMIEMLDSSKGRMMRVLAPSGTTERSPVTEKNRQKK
jgi:stage II sporulation protein R